MCIRDRAGAGRHDEFRAGLRKLMVLVVAVAVVGAVGAFVLGPTVGAILFNDFTMGAGGLGLLAAGSGVFIIALTLAQALMALGGHRMTAMAWGLGAVVCMALMAVIGDLELRVDVGFLVGSAVTAAVMFVGVARRRAQMESMGIEGLVTAIEQEPIEI